MKLLFVFFFVVAIVQNVKCAMSEAQMMAALRLVRNMCQPKSKATDQQIAAMHEGDWNQDRPGKCYSWCVLNSYKLIRKDNSFDWETGVKSAQTKAPPNIAPFFIECLTQCKDSVKTPADKCEAGYEIMKCIYECNPEKYAMP